MKIKVTLTRVTSQDIHTESSFDILDYQIRCMKQHQQRSKAILVAGKAKLHFKRAYWYETKRLTEPIVHLRSNIIVRIRDIFFLISYQTFGNTKEEKIALEERIIFLN